MKYIEFNKYKKLKKNPDNDTYEGVSKNNNNIKIDVTENGILLSEEDFGSLIKKIDDLESVIEGKNNQIEEIENLIDINYLMVQEKSEKSAYKKNFYLFNKINILLLIISILLTNLL